MKHELLVNLLNRALTEEMGLVITTNNPRQLSYHLHQITKSNPTYAPLIITIPSTAETVIIAKRSVELNEVDLS